MQRLCGGGGAAGLVLALDGCAKADGDGEFGLGRAQLNSHKVLHQHRQIVFLLFCRLLLSLPLLVVELDYFSGRQLDLRHVLRSNILPVIFDEIGLSLEARLVVPFEAVPGLLDRVGVDLHASHPPDVSREEFESADVDTILAGGIDKDVTVF